MIAAANTRSSFQGLAQIVRFNWTMYGIGSVTFVAVAALAAFVQMPDAARAILLAGATLSAAWLAMSLVVSYWVYDRSRLCRWDWIAAALDSKPRSVVNIHAGFDESSDSLIRAFPNAKLRVLDIFEPAEMTEPSISRAREQSTSVIAAMSTDFRHLPLPDASINLVTLLLSAHELRSTESRRAFFAELRRILAPEGRIVIAEHLRDLPNFIAFGPGFTHFHSRSTWLSAARDGGFVIDKEFSITPFVRIFVIRGK